MYLQKPSFWSLVRNTLCANWWVFVLALSLSHPSRLSAQAVGEIIGEVKDQTGAVVPNAKITAVEERTGLSYSTISMGAGNYSLTNLPIGTYTVSATASGFKIASITGITLDVNQQRDVDFALVVGGMAQQLNVTAAPPLIDTTNATLGGVVTGQQISTLPLNGRDITQLITLEPGTAIDPNGAHIHEFATGQWTSSNGQRGTSVDSYLDGVDTTDPHFGGASLTAFNLDAVAEFRVQQNNYTAEYGRGGGMIVQVASKTGTNQFHGSLFEFVRNSDMDSRSFFATTVPPLQRNEFGGTIGGPIKKDKTFFFFDAAALRQLSGNPAFYKFPSPDNRQGIIDITGANGQPDQLIVPLNSNAQTLLGEYPMPNDPTGPYGAQTYYNAIRVALDTSQYSGRIDHRFSEKDSIFGRLSYMNQREPIIDRELAVFNQSWGGHFAWNPRNAVVTETHVFSPTLVNALQLVWTRQDQQRLTAPAVAVTSVATNDGSLASYGPFAGGWSAVPDTAILNDSIHWVKGRHTMSTGFEWRDTHSPETGESEGGVDGNYTFGRGTPIPVAIPSASGLNNLLAGSPSPSGLASVMLGIPFAYAHALAFPGFGPQGGSVYQMRQWNINGFFQDNIALSPKLTLNIGIRYEFNSVPTEEHHKNVAIVDDPNLDGGAVYRAMVINPTPLYHPDYRGWGPRFGVAYRLDNETVIRGGFGIFTFIPPIGASDQGPANFPYASYGVTSFPTFQLTPFPIGNVPYLTDLKGNIMPPNGNNDAVPPNTPLNLGPAAAFFGGPIETNLISMGHVNGYGINGNVTLERQLPGDMALSIAYVASNGVKIPNSEYPNAYTGALPQYTPFTDAYPGIGEFALEDSHSHSTYNSLQVVLRKTSPKHGLTFQVSYAYSNELDNGDSVYNGNGPNLAESSGAPQSPNCYRCEKAPGSINFPQDFVADFIYLVPFDSLHALSALPRRLTQGWQIAGIPRVISGAPFTVTSPYPIGEFGTDTWNGTVETRPQMVGTATLNSKSNYASTLSFFTPSVAADGANLGQQIFSTPGGAATGFQTGPGDLGRNTFRTPLTENVDFSVFKDTKITESKLVQFRAEFFNVFNLHYFNSVDEVLGDSGFGALTSTTPGRVIQFGLRLIF